jgi:hypothetical protein
VPSAVPPSFGDAALVTDGSFPTDRRCPVSLAPCAGAYWAPLPLRRSVRRLPGPFAAAAAPVSTSHRVSLPTLDGYSSRSQPVLRDVGREYGSVTRLRQARSAAPAGRRARSRRSPAPAGGDSVGTRGRSASVRRGRRQSLAPTRRDADADTRHRVRAKAAWARSPAVARPHQCQPGIASSAAVFSASSVPSPWTCRYAVANSPIGKPSSVTSSWPGSNVPFCSAI